MHSSHYPARDGRDYDRQGSKTPERDRDLNRERDMHGEKDSHLHRDGRSVQDSTHHRDHDNNRQHHHPLNHNPIEFTTLYSEEYKKHNNHTNKHDDAFYDRYKDARYYDLEHQLTKSAEEVKVLQTALISKDKEVVKIKNETLRWYADSNALHKYGHGYHFHSGEFLKDLEEHRRNELKMLRENNDFKVQIINLKHEIDKIHVENEL